MGLKIDIFVTKASFSFQKLCFICPELNWENDNFCVFNPVLPRSEKYPSSPKYCVFLSDCSWKWYVLLFSTLLNIYCFKLGSESACCAKTVQLVYTSWDKSLMLNVLSKTIGILVIHVQFDCYSKFKIQNEGLMKF